MTTKLNTKLKTISSAILIAGVAGAVSMPVAAKKYRDYRDNSAFDYAKVVDVSPIVETYKVNNPVEQCWDERVPTRQGRYDRKARHNSPTGEILGAIIGGAIGNQFGSGRGKKVATVAGAVLGASVGHDVKHARRDRDRHARDRYGRDQYGRDQYGRDRHDYDRYEVVQRCELRDNYVVEEQVVGYNVAYKYRGNVFHTEMDQHPGKKIKVKVTVNPV